MSSTAGDLGSVIMAYDVWHKPYGPYNRPEWMLDRSRGGAEWVRWTVRTRSTGLLWIIGYDVATVSAQQGSVHTPEIGTPQDRLR